MRYAFGEYELDAQLYELRHAGTLLKIEPQVFNVLAYLIQHRDRTVPQTGIARAALAHSTSAMPS